MLQKTVFNAHRSGLFLVQYVDCGFHHHYHIIITVLSYTLPEQAKKRQRKKKKRKKVPPSFAGVTSTNAQNNVLPTGKMKA